MKSDQYYIAELENKILETVYEQTKDIPRPWGIVLSGGFDSGLLAAITKPDYVFSISFPYGPKYDEGRYRDAIIEHLGLKKVNIIPFTKEDFLPNLKEGVKIMGEPLTHFSLAPFNLLMKRIGEVKGSNVLSGEGPDEYLGGYARQIIFDEIKRLYGIPELVNYHGMIDRTFGVPISNKDVALLRKYYDLVYGGDDKTFNDFMEKLDGKYDLQGLIGKMDMELGVIEKMEQKLANAHGVKLHYPYINDAFAKYCYKLPDHLKIRNGVTKWIFREISKKYLPPIMTDRIKMGGPVAPVNHWIENSGGEYSKESYLKLQEEILNGKA